MQNGNVSKDTLNAPDLKVVTVVAAIILNENNEIYCAQRGAGGVCAYKWEFPGGKVEIGETKEEALVREIREELGCCVFINDYFTTVTYDYPTFRLHMDCFFASIVDGEPKVSVHIDSGWFNVDNLQSLDWAPADAPIIELLSKI